MNQPKIVSAAEWQKERDELLLAEKEVTRANDAVAARRRRLPMVEFDTRFAFDAPTGKKTLLDLFNGHRELVVYQFMDLGPDKFCPGCTGFSNNVPAHALELLDQRGIAWAHISNMPLAQIEAYKKKMGWTMTFYSSHGTDFAKACDSPYFKLTSFLCDDDKVYRTWNTTGRGVDHLLFVHSIQDLVAYGRQEEWEDSPEGWPQHPTYSI